MKKNIEKIQQIMKLYYDKQEENNELINKNSLEKKDLSERLLNIKEAKQSEREDLNRQLDELKHKKEEEISEKVYKYKEQYFPKNLTDTIESEYKKRKDDIESEIEKCTLTLKELKGTTKTEENKALLSSQIKEINKKIKSLKNELENLDANKRRELDTTIPSVIYGVFENIIKSELEPLYNEKEQELQSKILGLCNETEEEIEIKKLLESMPDYRNVYNREMVYLKGQLVKLVYKEIQSINYMITIVSNEKNRIIKNNEKKNNFLNFYQTKQSSIMQDLTNFKYEYDENGKVTNANVWDDLSKKLRSVSDRLRFLQSYSSNNTENIESYDNQIEDLKNDLKIAEENKLILGITDEEGKSILRSLSSSETNKYIERNYEAKTELKIKLLIDKLEDKNINIDKNKIVKTQEFSKISGQTFVELKSSNLDVAKTQEFSTNFDDEQKAEFSNNLPVTNGSVDMVINKETVDDIGVIIEEVDAKKIKAALEKYEDNSKEKNKSKISSKNPNAKKIFDFIETFCADIKNQNESGNEDDIIIVR